MDWQDAGMRALRERAESLPAGWVMHTSVKGDEHLPTGFSISGHEEFDAVAVGPEGGIVFEVIHQRAAESQEKIARIERIRQRLRKFNGWDVEVIVLARPESLARRDEIDSRLQAVTELLESAESSGNEEMFRAAFVLTFSVLEWTLAQHFDASREKRPMTGHQMAEKLVSEGILSEAAYREIREFQTLRNEIIHGLSVRAQIDSETVRQVKEVAETVKAELSKVHM